MWYVCKTPRNPSFTTRCVVVEDPRPGGTNVPTETESTVVPGSMPQKQRGIQRCAQTSSRATASPSNRRYVTTGLPHIRRLANDRFNSSAQPATYHWL